jgi:hypothetical protein
MLRAMGLADVARHVMLPFNSINEGQKSVGCRGEQLLPGPYHTHPHAKSPPPPPPPPPSFLSFASVSAATTHAFLAFAFAAADGGIPVCGDAFLFAQGLPLVHFSAQVSTCCWIRQVVSWRFSEEHGTG